MRRQSRRRFGIATRHHVIGDTARRAIVIGPVQLLVLGFPHPAFHGEIRKELQSLLDGPGAGDRRAGGPQGE
jgi:hypothetical protein